MHPILRQYMVLTEFLGQALGPQYEIALHDLTSEEQAVAAIVNGHISGRSVGAPMTDLALRFVKNQVYREMDYKTGYTGVSGQNARIRSSTMFIKDEDGSLLGMLCINYDASAAADALDVLSDLLGLDKSPARDNGFLHAAVGDSIETFSSSVKDLVADTLAKVLDNPTIPRERMTQEEKLEVVDTLNQKGVFLLKGAVSEVAAQLYSSEATIYRYLSKLNKHAR